MTPRSDNSSVSSPAEGVANGGKIRTALFAGSFNPFTRGHLRIVERALRVADKVIVAIGYNIFKVPEQEKAQYLKDILKREDQIATALAYLNPPEGPTRVEVTNYTCLTAEFARNMGADFLVRGVRNVSDFEYERNLADVNLKILGIDTLFFCAEPEYSYLSSSTIRELDAHGYDTSPLLPDGF